MAYSLQLSSSFLTSTTVTVLHFRRLPPFATRSVTPLPTYLVLLLHGRDKPKAMAAAETEETLQRGNQAKVVMTGDEACVLNLSSQNTIHIYF